MERIELAVSDGTKMAAYVSRPEGARSTTPGILVFQEAFGVNAHIRDVAQRFANLGFTVIAPELFHRTAPEGAEFSYADPAFRSHLDALTTEGLLADIQAAYDWLSREPNVDRDRIASIGFCMGGRASYLANSEVALKAAASFYGGGINNLLDRVQAQHGPLLMFWGGRDQHILPENYRAVADALTQAGKTHEQVVFSQADHAFFNDQRPAYEPGSARQAWALTLEFLRTSGVL
jgi:carboxymethylenebutenolidase